MTRYRDALLFATTGWDPTWERQVSASGRAVWTTAVSVLSALFGGAALLAWLYAPPEWRPVIIALAGGWLVAVGVIQVLVRREVLRRIDIEADQIAAREIQARLLPADLPTAATFELAAHYAPYREIGGDYYDVAALDERHWLIAMADVSGKGTGAALLTASVQALVHFAYVNEPTLEAAAAAINRHLVRFAPRGHFVTMVLGVLDLERRVLRYVNAGHNPPLGLTPDGTVLRLAGTGLALGAFASATYTAAEVALPAGTTCLFYTDGLVERLDRRQALFGEERVIDTLRTTAHAPRAADVVAALTTAADRFAGGVEAADDVALLVLRGR